MRAQPPMQTPEEEHSVGVGNKGCLFYYLLLR